MLGWLFLRFQRAGEALPPGGWHTSRRSDRQCYGQLGSSFPPNGSGANIGVCDQSENAVHQPGGRRTIPAPTSKRRLDWKVEVFSIGEAEFTTAEVLVERYAFDSRLRALDALQLAVALELRNQKLVDHFVAADAILCDVAGLEGFSVINPEHP